MAKRHLTPYLDQALTVLNRTAGVAPARIRALGFLKQQMRERTLTAPIAGERPGGLALGGRDDAGQVDRR